MAIDPNLKALARRVAALERAKLLSKQPTLRFSAIEDGAIQSVQDDSLKAILGMQYDGTQTVAVFNGPTPPTPSNAIATAGLEGAIIRWDGTFADGSVAPMDFSRVEVHASTDPAFTAEFASTLKATFETPRGAEVFVGLPGDVIHYVKLVCRSQTGARSATSANVAVTPQALLSALPDPTDGLAPASSPTPTLTPGIGSIFVSWTPVTNDDPVTYEVHVSTTTGFTPGPTTKAGETEGTLLAVRSLPSDSSILDYATTYYVKIVAKDADGAAAASTQASAAPKQVTGPDVAAETITGDHLIGNTITADKFAATLAMVSALLVGDRISITPEDGIKIDLDDGVIQFPADGSDAYITAAARMKALTVENNLRILGTVNKVEGGVNLADGVTAPTVAPQAGYTWSDPLTKSATQAADSIGFNQGFADYNSTEWIYVESLFGGAVWVLNKTTKARFLVASVQSNSYPAGACSPAQDGNIYVLVTDANRSNNMYIYRYNSNVKQSETLIANASAMYPGVTPAICADGAGTIRVGYVRATDGKLVVVSCAIDGTTKNVSVTSSFATGNSIGNNHISGMYAGNADWGVKRLAFTFRGSNYIYVTADSSGSTWDTAKHFERANAAELRGFGWDGTRFHSLDSGGNVYHYSTLTADTSRSVTYTWFDNDAGGTGQHETQASPAKVVTQKKRWWLQVTTDPPQDGGGTDDPNAIRIYVANQRQADLGAGVTTATYDVPATGGSGAPTSNGFAGVGAPGQLISERVDANGALIKLLGDASWRLGRARGDKVGNVYPGLAIINLSTGTSQAVASGTWVQGSMGLDPSPGQNNDIFTCFSAASSGVLIAEDGWYDISAYLSYDTFTATCRCLARIVVAASAGAAASGSGIGQEVPAVNGVPVAHSLSRKLYLTAGQHVRLEGWQNSGVTRNFSSRWLQVVRL